MKLFNISKMATHSQQRKLLEGLSRYLTPREQNFDRNPRWTNGVSNAISILYPFLKDLEQNGVLDPSKNGYKIGMAYETPFVLWEFKYFEMD